jgi:hypothetical protein
MTMGTLCSAATHDDNRLAIAKAGGIATIVSDMEAHDHHVGVQGWELSRIIQPVIQRKSRRPDWSRRRRVQVLEAAST